MINNFFKPWTILVLIVSLAFVGMTTSLCTKEQNLKITNQAKPHLDESIEFLHYDEVVADLIEHRAVVTTQPSNWAPGISGYQSVHFYVEPNGHINEVYKFTNPESTEFGIAKGGCNKAWNNHKSGNSCANPGVECTVRLDNGGNWVIICC